MVSIIIPYYNNQNTILETLESVFNQSYKNIEVILVDDGSKDDIQPIVEHYITDKKLILLKQKNSGVSYARNYGSKQAKGKYLLFLDSDDLIDSNYIKKCVEVYDNNPELKIVYSNARIFGRENKKWQLGEYTTFSNFLIGNCIYVSALIKKEDFDAVNGFDTDLTFYEDWDLWISILKGDGQIYKIPEELFFYRKNENLVSVSDIASSDKNIHAKNRLKIYVKHYDLYEKEFTHFEQIFMAYIKSLHKKRPSKKKWYQKIFN